MRREIEEINENLVSTKIEKPDIGWAYINNKWINTSNPYYKAHIGEIPLLPEIFETLVPPSSLIVATEVFAKIAESKNTTNYSYYPITYDEDDYIGWTSEQLRIAILASGKRIDTSIITNDENDKEELFGMRLPTIFVDNNFKVRLDANSYNKKLFYQEIYRRVYNTATDWDKAGDYGISLKQPTVKYHLKDISDDEATQILSSSGISSDNLFIAAAFLLNRAGLLFDEDSNIVNNLIFFNLFVNNDNIKPKFKSLSDAILLSSLLENDKEKIYSYVLREFGSDAFESYDEYFKNDYEKLINKKYITSVKSSLPPGIEIREIIPSSQSTESPTRSTIRSPAFRGAYKY